MSWDGTRRPSEGELKDGKSRPIRQTRDPLDKELALRRLAEALAALDHPLLWEHDITSIVSKLEVTVIDSALLGQLLEALLVPRALHRVNPV